MIKQTDREKDYAVIGEIARRMTDTTNQLLFSRSALDLTRMAERHSTLVKQLARKRPLLASINQGRNRLEAALDAEHRELIHAIDFCKIHFAVVVVRIINNCV